MQVAASLFETAGLSLKTAAFALIAPAILFAGVALFAHGRGALGKARDATGEVRTNMLLYGFDALLVGPALAIAMGFVGAWQQRAGLPLLQPSDWSALPVWLVGFAALFIGDFIGYWRHRLEHTPFLWPAHAIHHSDERMTWTTLHRFHPINRFTTALIDTTLLAACGLPPWALVLNNLTRHWYGMFIHMDVPWTYGPLGRVFVSPVMHRWHHVRDADGAGYNFATVFSVFDQAFRTHHVPGPCDVPLGVRDAIGKGAWAQLMWPFKALWCYVLRHSGARAARTRNPGATPALYDPLGSGSRSARPE